MNCQQDILEEIAKKTINLFNENEKYLLNKDLSERCIVSKFAMHLDSILKEYYEEYTDYQVDVEYNRNYKEGHYVSKMNPDNEKNIVVDLIVHRRGEDKNLICMEFKKKSNRRSIDSDIKRLKMMTNNNGIYRYMAGFMMIIDSEKIFIEQVFPLSL